MPTEASWRAKNKNNSTDPRGKFIYKIQLLYHKRSFIDLKNSFVVIHMRKKKNKQHSKQKALHSCGTALMD